MADYPTRPPTSGFRVRPRFEHDVDFPEDVARERITSTFGRNTATFDVRSMSEFVVIHVAEQIRRRWSPRLQISLQAIDEKRTRVTGVYGPEHEVWATFLYGYMMAGLMATFSGIYGGVQVFLGDWPWALWVTGSMFVFAGLLYLLAQFGQKLGAWQTFQLHQTYQTAVGAQTGEASAEMGGGI
jgi:hypothetical protein